MARLLGVQPCRVPHFVYKYKGRWAWHFHRWCARRGYVAILVPVRGVYSVTNLETWIEMGWTKKKTYHAVLVGRGEVIYDGGNPLRRVDRCVFIVRLAR